AGGLDRTGVEAARADLHVGPRLVRRPAEGVVPPAVDVAVGLDRTGVGVARAELRVGACMVPRLAAGVGRPAADALVERGTPRALGAQRARVALARPPIGRPWPSCHARRHSTLPVALTPQVWPLPALTCT